MTLLTPSPASKPLYSTSLTSGIVGPVSGADVGLAVEDAPLSGDIPKATSAGDRASFATELDATLQSLVPGTLPHERGPQGPAHQGVEKDLIAPSLPEPSKGIPAQSVEGQNPIKGGPAPLSRPAALSPGTDQPLPFAPSETGKTLPPGGAVLPPENNPGSNAKAPRNPALSGFGPVTAQLSSGFSEPSDAAVPNIGWVTPRAPLEPQGERVLAPEPQAPVVTPPISKAAPFAELKPTVAGATISAFPDGGEAVTLARSARRPEVLPDTTSLPRRVPAGPVIDSKVEPAPRPETLGVSANRSVSPTQAAPSGDAPDLVTLALSETSDLKAQTSASVSPSPSARNTSVDPAPAPSAKSAGPQAAPSAPVPLSPTPNQLAEAGAVIPQQASPETSPPSPTLVASKALQTDAPRRPASASSADTQEPPFERAEAAARPATSTEPSEATAPKAKPILQAVAATTGAATPTKPVSLPASPAPQVDPAPQGSDPLSAPPLVSAAVPVSASTLVPKPADLRSTPTKVSRGATSSEPLAVARPDRSATAELPRFAPVGEAAAAAILAEGNASQTGASSSSLSTTPSAAATLPASAPPSVAAAPVASNPAPSLTPASAPVSAPTTAAITASVEQFVEQISEAREAGRALRPELTVRTGDFGNVGLRIDPSAGAHFNDWRATLVSRDPGFVPAVQAALAERAVMAASESGLSQNGAFSQRGGEQSSQNSGSHNSASNQSQAGSNAGFQGGGAGQEPRYGSSTGGDQGSAKPYSGEETGNGLDQAAADTRNTPSSEGLDGLSSGPGGALFA